MTQTENALDTVLQIRGPWMVGMARDNFGGTKYQICGTHTHTLVVVDPTQYYAKDKYPEQDEDGYYIPDDRIDCVEWRVNVAYVIAAIPEVIEFLRSIATQSTGPDWTAEQAFEFCRAQAREAIDKMEYRA